jgi:cellulose synthase operon protein C
VLRNAFATLLFLAVGASAQSSSAFVWPNKVELIERELSDRDPGLRRRAAQRLHELPVKVARRLMPKAMADPDPEVRLFAAEAARELDIQGAGEHVIGWLNDPERRVRLAAAELLTESPSAGAIAPLGRVLSDPDPAVRSAAADALGASGMKEAGLPLLGHLDDSAPNVRRAVIAALARLRDQRAIVPLIGKIQDAQPLVRRAVARALGQLGDPRATSALVLALRDSDESVRVAALEALAQLADKSAALAVVSLLREDGRPAVRAAALAALAAIPSTEGVDALMNALGSDDPEAEESPVRRALSSIGDRAAKRLLDCLVGQPAPALADGCALSLAEAGNARAAAAIADALHRGVVRTRAALRALGRLGNPASVPVVLEYLVDPDPFVRKSAVDAAGALLDPQRPDGRAVEPIARALDRAGSDKTERAALIALLGKTGSPRAVARLMPLAEHTDDPSLRIAALEALGQLGPAGQDRALLASLDADEPPVRLAAGIALRRSASGASARVLLDRLDRAAEQDRAAITIALAGAFARTRDARDLARGERLLSMSREGERDALIEALGRSGMIAPRLVTFAEKSGSMADRAKVAEALGAHPSALGALRKLATDADTSVRANAVWALGTNGGRAELPALATAVRDRDVAVAGNAMAALGRIAARTRAPVGAHLCGALSDSRSYVRANALSALRVAKLRCTKGEEIALLSRDRSDVVRRAAAELVASVTGASPVADRAALSRCTEQDPSGSVAATCAEPESRATTGTEPISVFVIPNGETSPQPRVPFALVFADGLMRLGVTDRRGSVFEAAAPRGYVTLAVPAPLAK